MTKLSELDAMLTFGADDILAATENATGNSKSVAGSVLRAYVQDADVTAATDAATVNTLMKRDAAGRAKVVAPAVAADIALKSTVTADIATHDALATAHGFITTTISLGGNFSGSNNLSLSKVGNQVTAQWATLSFTSSSFPQSASGIIPAAYRPAVSVYFGTYHGSIFLQTVLIETIGRFSIVFRDYSGSLVNKISAEAGAVSWLTA